MGLVQPAIICSLEPGQGSDIEPCRDGGLVAKLSLTLVDPMDCSPPGSSAHGIFQAGILKVGCHFLLQGNLSNPGIEAEAGSSAVQADSLLTELPGKPLIFATLICCWKEGRREYVELV